MSRISTYGRMPITRSRQLPFNPSLSHTLQKWRQPENTILKGSDPVPLGRDVTFTFVNLPDHGSANSFTLKEKGWKSPALQGDSGNSRDSDLLDSSDPDCGNFNNNNNNDDKVNNYLGDID